MAAVPRHAEWSRQRQLLALIADGEVHSGADLARCLAVSRTAVWHYAQALATTGIEIEAVRGSGYRLAQPVELLDAAAIHQGLSESVCNRLRKLDVLFETDSTNQRLTELAVHDDVHGHACMAEVQTAGRGRRGRRWLATLGGGICLSVAWRFGAALEALAGLSLAVGLSVHRALRVIGIGEGLKLKWPNDVLYHGRKLAGVLVEVSGEVGGPCLAVIGIGVNVALPPVVLEQLNQSATDVHSALGYIPSRNQTAAALLNELLQILPEFERRGFAAFEGAWMEHDGLRGRIVDVAVPAGVVSGQAEGVAADGALLVRVGGKVQRFHSGEVSVRLAR